MPRSTNLRGRILQMTEGKVGERFYREALAADLGASPGGVRTAMDRLVDLGHFDVEVPAQVWTRTQAQRREGNGAATYERLGDLQDGSWVLRDRAGELVLVRPVDVAGNGH